MSKDVNVRMSAQDANFVKQNASSLKMSNSEYAGIIFRAGMMAMYKAMADNTKNTQPSTTSTEEIGVTNEN